MSRQAAAMPLEGRGGMPHERARARRPAPASPPDMETGACVGVWVLCECHPHKEMPIK